MTAHIAATEAFRYTTELRRLAGSDCGYSFSVTGTWPGAEQPNAEQTAVQFTLDTEGLLPLRDPLTAEVQSCA